MPTGNEGQEPGQSPEGGSGQGQPQGLGLGQEYSDADFFSDLLADGIISGSGKEQVKSPEERGAPEKVQSDNKGSEPGAEPQQVKDPETTQPQGELEKPATVTTEVPAQVPPVEGGEQQQQQLTPEERWRREAQSAKDQLYAERQEKEKLLEQFNTRQQSDIEAQLEARHQQLTSPQRNLCNSLAEQYQAALADEDHPLAQQLAQQWNDAKYTLDYMEWNHTQTVAQQKQAQVKQAQQQHVKVLDAQLKEDFDTSVAELIKIDPKLNLFDPFSVQKAVAKVNKEKTEARLESVKKEAEKILDTARTKWGHENPGSQPDREANANGVGRGDGLPDYSTMSETAILEDVLSEVIKSSGGRGNRR
jgi:hypothetical protein